MLQPLLDQLQQTLRGTHILERELGGGGMSRVFVAEEVRLKRKVVVKVLSPDLAQGISVERFEREIQTVAALQQANIVPVHTAGDTDGLPYYTMPFVEGESLRTRLERGPLAVSEVIDILRDVTRALAYAHERGVVHRDIKPDNVLMSGGAAVVTDFGIAKAISASRTASGDGLTQTGTSLGTPAYMAPEQVAGDPHIDHRADIYALGATAYELLAGHVVFPGRTPQRMLAAHVTDAPTPIAAVRADVPAALADLVMRCLAKDAGARPQSASDIARVLDTITSASGMQALPLALSGPGVFTKALVVYAGSFIAVAILTRVAIVRIGLPEWVFAGALIVMALGLPVVLWTGYVQRVARSNRTPATTHGAMASMALKAAPHVSWYRTARGGMVALGAFVVLVSLSMALRVAGVGPFATLLGSGRLKEREPILLTDFRTANTDSTLGRVISDAVRAGLSGSSAITLVPPSTVAAALARMQRPPGSRVDSLVGRELAIREGVKAMVDGEVTGVAGGYIVMIRLVRVDSGVELASFRETGDGPRGLIDAADKVARALRSKAGESLRSVNATLPLAQATTSSLDALRKYSAAVRAQTRLDVGAVALAREAVAIDSTFASAWTLLGLLLRDYGDGTRSALDSAFRRAYELRDRLPPTERYRATVLYFGGPGRDRAKAIVAHEAALARGDSTVLVALGEALREQRQFARAESLNVAWVRQRAQSSSALGNIVELRLDQGNIDGAATTVEQLRRQFPSYAALRHPFVLFAKGDFASLQRLVDSMRHAGPPNERAFASRAAANLALLHGRLSERNTLLNGVPLSLPSIGQPSAIDEIIIESSVAGPSPRLAARLDSAIAKATSPAVPITDRPYLAAAGALARIGNAPAARAMLARYRAEVSDTAIRRDDEAAMHAALGEVALAERNAAQAVTEFRRSDIAYDGKPVDECAPCVSFHLGRAFDAANQPDSAIASFERYLATPYWDKIVPTLDPIRVPAIHERLGQIYEAKGNAAKAAEHYRAFIELWKNADAELQPRVAEARRRLVSVTPVERPR